MTQEQIGGLIRELLFAIAAVLVSFNFMPDTQVDTWVAALTAIGVTAWGIASKQGTSVIVSLIRKTIQAVPPVLVLNEVITTEQGGTITALLLAIVGAWSFKSNGANPTS